MKLGQDQFNHSLQETQKELLAALADLEATQKSAAENEELLTRQRQEN